MCTAAVGALRCAHPLLVTAGEGKLCFMCTATMGVLGVRLVSHGTACCMVSSTLIYYITMFECRCAVWMCFTGVCCHDPCFSVVCTAAVLQAW
jgi:hypothetical protein